MSEELSIVPHRVRLWAIFARDAPKAVILRRGPKTHYQLIAWDLRTDTFRRGQWLKGFVRLWDLSPSGDKLIYWAHQYHASASWRRTERGAEPGEPYRRHYEPLDARPRNRAPKKGEKRRRIPRYMRRAAPPGWSSPPRRNQGVWTAISTPPYFSALAIWPSFGHWTGGGFFLSEREIVLREPDCGLTPKENVRFPSRIKLRSINTMPALNREGGFSGWHAWMCEASLKDRISKALIAAGARWVEWIAPRENALFFACDGCVFRLAGWHHRPPEDYLASAEKIADFTHDSFTLIAPHPAALQW